MEKQNIISKLACSRLSVSGGDRKSGCGTNGISLVPRPLFRSPLLTESLELAISKLIAFVKERFHNAVEIDILGIFGRSIWPPRKILQGQILQVQMMSLQSTMCFACLTFSFTCRSGLFVCRVSSPFIRVWCTCLSNSGLYGLLSSKLRCLRLKIELLAF